MLLVLLMQWSIGKGMIEYVNTKEIEQLKPVLAELSEEYAKSGSWKSMQDRHSKFRNLIDQQLEDSQFLETKYRKHEHRRGPPGPKPMRKEAPFIGDKKHAEKPPNISPKYTEQYSRRGPPPPRYKSKGDAHYALLDQQSDLVVGKYLPELQYTKTSIQFNGSVVGYFAVSKRNQLIEGYELDFIEQQEKYLWIIALVCMGLVALVTMPLGRHVLEPIKSITRGMHRLTQGDYQQPIKLNRRDELGQLSRDYNELALTLSENETARKRWLADVSHELRTPIAILGGELEAMLDGIRPMTQENISSANDELQHLKRLIDDLQQLTSAEIGGMRYQKNHENLSDLLLCEMDKYRSFLSDANMSLSVDMTNSAVNCYIDKTRLNQLVENIINNAIKYASGSQFHISLSLTKVEGNNFAVLRCEDDGVGIESEHLSHIFEHLYRVENSRNRQTGGSGLGLAICRQIVIAHQGEISAECAKLGGLAVIVKLPMT